MNMQNDTEVQLTAYALGELSPEERVALESRLAEDAELRRELDEIRATVDLLGRELGGEQPSLSAERRDAILAERSMQPEAAPPPTRLERKRGRRLGAVLGAGAGVLAMAASALLFLKTGAQEPALSVKANEEQAAIVARAPATPALASAAAADDSPGGREREQQMNTEKYDEIVEKGFTRVEVDPRSTFSIDVDTAAYALMRRFINDGALPPTGAVRIEEMLNYFSYDYPEPRDGKPFAVSVDVANAPWARTHRLVRIGIKAKDVPRAERKPSNLVFLLDVSGSMSDENKLPLLKRSLKLLLSQLGEDDHVAIVVYAGASGLVLPSTSAARSGAIESALSRLEAGGSTNGGEGIRLAYAQARQNFVEGGVNRVILATDGDFNVGVTNQSDLVDLIQKEAKSGVFLSVLGFGGGNYNDSVLEKLADRGNGNYAYIDSEQEARKVLVEQATGTLITVAKDVKIQVEMNPAEVAGYRLIGYENRVLAHSDFEDDKKDAGEIGAGHTVTALYEVVPRGQAVPGPAPAELKYQKPRAPSPEGASGELLTVKLRYQRPEGSASELIEVPLRDTREDIGGASADFRFAAAVAELGLLLRDSQYKGDASYASVLSLARAGAERDPRGHRREFIGLVEKARALSR